MLEVPLKMPKKTARRKVVKNMIAPVPAPNGDAAAARLATYRRNNLRFFTVFRVHLDKHWTRTDGFAREQFAAAVGISELGARFWQTLQERYGDQGTQIVRDLVDNS
jgi:hypothetical protein